MQRIETTSSLRAQVKAWRKNNKTVALVPTMGSLHKGHLSLVNKAKELADHVVVSIFVNPLQFDDKADLTAYPRTIDSDIQIEFSDIESNKRLPRNVAEDEVKDEEERVIELCEKIKHISKLMNDSKISQIEEINELKLAVLQKYNENRARLHKNLIHNVQSDFDTYVKNTKLEAEHEELKILRGYVSMPLHLLEVSLWLVH